MTTRTNALKMPRAEAQRTTLRALRVAQVLGGVAQAVGGSAGALLARNITGSDAPAGWPQAAITAGAAVAAIGVSVIAERTSRRFSLGTALIVGAVGAGVCAASASTASLLLVIVGSFLFGAGNAAVMLARYAATDLADQSNRGKAIGSVLVATSVGAAAGPNLLGPTVAAASDVGLPGYAGPYVAAALAYLLAAGTFAVMLSPDPLALAKLYGTAAEETATGTRVAELLARRHSLTAAVALCVANFVMVALMTMAPVELVAMGHGLGVVGAVISVHIAAMFAPSPLSGRLTDLVGAPRTIVVGAVMMVGAGASAVLGVHSTLLLTCAVVLLGCGWNASVVAASAMLTAATPVSARPKLEACGEVLMGVAATVGGIACGVLVDGGGYALLALVSGVAAFPLLLTPRVTRLAPRQLDPSPASGPAP